MTTQYGFRATSAETAFVIDWMFENTPSGTVETILDSRVYGRFPVRGARAAGMAVRMALGARYHKPIKITFADDRDAVAFRLRFAEAWEDGE